MHSATMKLVIRPDEVLQGIKRLKRNSSPGIDEICGEFLINGMSDALSSHLSYFYSCILSFNCVPMVFNIGVATNYRPIIVSSIFLSSLS